ncbi:glycosyltransferase [Planococcus sp. APC 4015]|nr:glycosyltransferase [Planococcus sp. APC 4015]
MIGRHRLRILVIAPLRFPIAQPHAGGLESAVWSEVHALRHRGHDVTLIAVRGSDFIRAGSAFDVPPLSWPQGSSPTDQSYPPSYEERSVPALERALDEVARSAGRYDVISNHCLHPLPLQRAPRLGVPMVTTLHTPVDDDFVSAHRAAEGRGSVFLSVSEHTRRSWARAGVPSRLLANGVDPASWVAGAGGDGLVWFGRVVPEKSPHLAVAAARLAGRPLTLAGRIGDREYADQVLFPLLGDDVDYVGPLAPAELVRLVGSSAVALGTPSWAEPFGLVAPESLMCGTPVVSFAVGGVPEIAARSVGMSLVRPGDVEAMAVEAEELIATERTDPTFRARVRASAVHEFSLSSRVAVLEDHLLARARGVVPISDELTA